MWWHTPVTPALGDLRWEHNKSKATQDSTESPCHKTKILGAFHRKSPPWEELPRKIVSGQIWKLRLGDVSDVPAVPAGHLLAASSSAPLQIIKPLLFSTEHKNAKFVKR